jgi:DNA polymerase III subunit delta
MRIGSEQLPAQLKRGFASLYSVIGEEHLLSLEASDRIREFARVEGFFEREVLTAEPEFDWSELAARARSLSLFSTKRLVELRIPSGKPGVEGSEALSALCASPIPGVVMLVVVPVRLDRQTERSRWFEALEQAGVVVEANPVPRERLPRWIGGRLSLQGQEADTQTLQFIADRVEGNLLAAHQEVQKLSLLAAPGKLSFEQVKEAVLDVARYDVFKLGEAMLSDDVPRLVRFLEGLKGEGVAPPLALWAIAEEIRTLLRVTAGLARGRPIATELREARVFGARQRLVQQALDKFDRKQLEDALIDAAGIDRMIKGVAKGDPWEAMLRLALSFARPARVTRETA